MLIGYARTSTVEQEAGFEAQKRELQEAGSERIFEERTSAIGPRSQLAAVLDFVREGDTLFVTKLDRLARSTAHALEIMTVLERKGCRLRILGMDLDTGTPVGRLMFSVIAAVAQFEREMMLERQREGIAKAKAAGLYKGRAPTARAKSAEVLALAAEGLSKPKIAKRLGIGERSVFRILSVAQPAAEESALVVAEPPAASPPLPVRGARSRRSAAPVPRTRKRPALAAIPAR